MEKTKDTPIKKWAGSNPVECDICHKPFEKSIIKINETYKTVFIDSRTVYGMWGLLCKDCHSKYGSGLGVGKGQMYDLKTLEKLEG